MERNQEVAPEVITEIRQRRRATVHLLLWRPRINTKLARDTALYTDENTAQLNLPTLTTAEATNEMFKTFN